MFDGRLLLEGYVLKEKLYDESHIAVYRGIRLQTQDEVILKFPRNRHPSAEDISLLQHEYNLLKKLRIPGLLQAYELIQDQEIPVLILENTEGTSLQNVLANQPLDLDSFFHFAVELINVIGKLHENNIVHKNLNSSNIIIGDSLQLTDFSLSTQLTEETQEYILDQQDARLHYKAPEQTGRINRPIDYRTDYYAIGIIFFEMLTGQLPFAAKDRLELMHYIIAKKAPLVTDYNKNVPPVLAEIVAKLLAKMAEERYTSIIGLKEDILKCANEWKERHKIRRFPIATKDLNDHLHLSHQLYGRENQVQELLLAFERVAQGNTELALVSGYSGIGKTSLVKEVHKPMARKQGYFIQGKFDQLQSYVPFSAIVNAFQNLIKQLLSENESKINLLKNQLLDSLGNLGQIIINVIPDLELIIGKQPPVSSLNSAETQHRFNVVFQKFIKVFAQKNSPIVIFLDDLQWADTASLKLIENILTNSEIRHLLILGAYRDNEVDQNHPLIKSLQELKIQQVNFLEIVLKPLKLHDVELFLKHTLTPAQDGILALAKCIHDKTQGNPFFMNVFLRYLYAEKILYFSYKEGIWKWDLEQIQKQSYTDNVIDLLTVKIHELPVPTQEILKLASCFGFRFDLQTLATVSQSSINKTAKDLWEGIKSGLIIPLEDGYKTATLAEQPENNLFVRDSSLHYRFAHDRIQQAAYQLIPNKETSSIHLKIGQLLLQKHPNLEQDEKLFEIMEQFNHSLDLIDPQAKYQLALYNLSAGIKAKNSTAYQAAKEYLQSAIKLLQPYDWQKDYELLFKISKNLTVCRYLTGEYNKAEETFALLHKKAKNVVDKIEIYRLNCEMLSTLNKHNEAVDLGLKALQSININIPRNPNRLNIIYAILKIKFQIGRRKIPDIELLPINDDIQCAAIDLITQLLNNAFIINQKLFILLTCTNIHLSLQYGYTKSNAMSFPVYAFVLMHSLNMYQEALEVTKLDNKFKKIYGESSFEGKNQFIYGSFIQPWQENISHSLDTLANAVALTYENGDLVYCNYSHLLLIINGFMASKSINEVKKLVQDSLAFIDKAQISDFKNMVQFWEYNINCFEDKDDFNLETLLKYEERIHRGKSKTELCFFYSYCTKLAYILGQTKTAILFGSKYEEYAEYGLGMVSNVECLFYYALAILNQYKKASLNERIRDRKKLKTILKKFKRWSTWAPSNFKPYYILLHAEIAAVKQKKIAAIKFYDKALALAQENNLTFFSAIANERTGNFYLRLKLDNLAKIYQSESYNLFRKWGSKANCKLLMIRHPDWFYASHGFAIEEDKQKEQATSSLDMFGILKAAELISSEIRLDRLRQKLLLIVLEVAGAERGVILFNEQNKWCIEAEGDIENQTIYSSLEDESKTEYKIPMSLLNYVQRTSQPLIIEEVAHSEIMFMDPYIQKTKPLSVMMLPIFYQGQLCRMLYLENKNTSHVFTSQHLQSLQLLTSQAMISLENAKLYHQASHDALTGIANRNLLEQIFEFDVVQAARVNKQTALFFLDLDNFKVINDTLGHEIGDQLLIHVTKILLKSLRKSDIVARIGGDEFAILVVGVNELRQIKLLADVLFYNFAQPVTIQGHQLQISPSMGICLYPKDAKDFHTLLKLADIALYHAKEMGKNQYYFYSDELQEEYRRIHHFEAELQRALELKQFNIYYQPIIDITTNKLIGLEALLRWQHPERGLLEAGEFINLLEKNPLIIPISEWIIYQVCQQASFWQQQGLLTVPIAINTSAVQFTRQSISHLLKTALTELNLDPKFIEIELTETTFIENDAKVFSEIDALHKLGINLVIDDFGTGYSSLSYLKRLTVSKIKIDQSFFQKGHDSHINHTIVQAITTLAHELQLKVIAEGIENKRQLAIAIHLGIDAAQGYLFSKPMNNEQIEQWLLTRNEIDESDLKINEI